MVRFVLRRLLSCIALLVAISILTFLIFVAMPNSNPALRLAGRTATQVQINAVEREWGFNKPIYVQYYKTMEKIFSGNVISYTQQLNVESRHDAEVRMDSRGAKQDAAERSTEGEEPVVGARTHGCGRSSYQIRGDDPQLLREESRTHERMCSLEVLKSGPREECRSTRSHEVGENSRETPGALRTGCP